MTVNYKKWDVVEVDIELILSTVSKRRRLDDSEQNDRVNLSGIAWPEYSAVTNAD